MVENSDAAIAALASRGVTSLPPLGLVLGSGLGGLADEAEDAIAIPYQDIPGFPVPSVAGHSGRLVVGALEGRRVALFQGRGHYYERGDPRAMFVAIETFERLGGRTLFLTSRPAACTRIGARRRSPRSSTTSISPASIH